MCLDGHMNSSPVTPPDVPAFDPALNAAEAKVFAEAALKLLAEGECRAAAELFYRAYTFARRAA